MKTFQDDILLVQIFLYALLERSKAQRRSSEETVVFAATTYTATTYTKDMTESYKRGVGM